MPPLLPPHIPQPSSHLLGPRQPLWPGRPSCFSGGTSGPLTVVQLPSNWPWSVSLTKQNSSFGEEGTVSSDHLLISQAPALCQALSWALYPVSHPFHLHGHCLPSLIPWPEDSFPPVPGLGLPALSLQAPLLGDLILFHAGNHVLTPGAAALAPPSLCLPAPQKPCLRHRFQ